jgi:hypothetical protein
MVFRAFLTKVLPEEKVVVTLTRRGFAERLSGFEIRYEYSRKRSSTTLPHACTCTPPSMASFRAPSREDGECTNSARAALCTPLEDLIAGLQAMAQKDGGDPQTLNP